MAIYFDGFAVRLARVIEPSRPVAALAAVDHAAIGKAEEKRMRAVFTQTITPGRAAPAHDLAFVFEDALAGPQGAQRIDAFSVHRRLPDSHSFAHGHLRALNACSISGHDESE
jgi:hypothetical protein